MIFNINLTRGQMPFLTCVARVTCLVYINDLPNEIKSDIYMFADDTKLFRTIKTNDDQCILQDDLEELTAWSTKWLLTFHPDKCKVMHLGKPLEEQFKYTLHDGSIIHELGYTSEERDIGVIIDSNLEFDKHVYFKVNRELPGWRKTATARFANKFATNSARSSP